MSFEFVWWSCVLSSWPSQQFFNFQDVTEVREDFRPCQFYWTPSFLWAELFRKCVIWDPGVQWWCWEQFSQSREEDNMSRLPGRGKFNSALFMVEVFSFQFVFISVLDRIQSGQIFANLISILSLCGVQWSLCLNCTLTSKSRRPLSFILLIWDDAGSRNRPRGDRGQHPLQVPRQQELRHHLPSRDWGRHLHVDTRGGDQSDGRFQ